MSSNHWRANSRLWVEHLRYRRDSYQCQYYTSYRFCDEHVIETTHNNFWNSNCYIAVEKRRDRDRDGRREQIWLCLIMGRWGRERRRRRSNSNSGASDAENKSFWPREVVLQERGIDWRKLDQDLQPPSNIRCPFITF